MASTALTNVQTDSLQLDQIQAATKTATQQARNNPANGGTILKGISLIVGDNSIAHKLGMTLQGWYLVRKKGPSEIYDNQDSNKTPTQTLTLNSSAATVVDIFVF